MKDATITPTKGKCPFCGTKGGKEQPLFSVKAEGLATAICGEHLWGFLKAKEEESLPAQEPG